MGTVCRSLLDVPQLVCSGNTGQSPYTQSLVLQIPGLNGRRSRFDGLTAWLASSGPALARKVGRLIKPVNLLNMMKCLHFCRSLCPPWFWMLLLLCAVVSSMFLRISFVLEHCCWFIFHLTFQGWQMAHSNSLKCADRMCSTGIGDSVISSYQCHGEKKTQPSSNMAGNSLHQMEL